jgi:uncharacterized protein (DUF302 family)
MKKILLICTGFMLLGLTQSIASTDNNQIFSVNNSKGEISAKSIEEAFNASGLHVDVNNDMNSIFSKRYKKVHHKSYNLAIFTDKKLIEKLIKKYPNMGLITPLSMSIYSDEATNTMNISTLSLKGMAKITHISVDNPDLKAYAKRIDTALHTALPQGKYLPKVKSMGKIPTLITDFTLEFDLEAGESYQDAKNAFKEEFESEISSVGFLVPKSYSIQSDSYDFYDTYSIIRFNVIFPLSKSHPDAGAYAPFSLAIYKKKNEKTAHIRFSSMSNWVNDLDVKDTKSLEEIKKTQAMLVEILEELTE